MKNNAIEKASKKLEQAKAEVELLEQALGDVAPGAAVPATENGFAVDRAAALNPHIFGRERATSNTFTPGEGFTRTVDPDGMGEMKVTDSDIEGFQNWHRHNRGTRLSLREYVACFGGG